MRVGERVARLREVHGESLREAAARTGVSHTTIARIENSQTVGSTGGTLRKIADGYRVPLEYLLTGKDSRADSAAQLVAVAMEAGIGRYIPVIHQLAEAGVTPEQVAIYSRMIRSAATAGLRPEVLDQAINLLVTMQRES